MRQFPILFFGLAVVEGLPFAPQIGICKAEYDIGGNLVRLYAKFAQDGGGSAVAWRFVRYGPWIVIYLIG